METGEKEILLIFSGYNTRAVISFLRTLAQNGIENYAIVALSDKDMIFRTAYGKKVLYTREKEQLDLGEFYFLTEYICEKTKKEKVFIIPSTEALNRFILRYRKELEAHRCVIPLAEESLYVKISDKESFCGLCSGYSLPVPEEIRPGDHYCMPFVAKPRRYLSDSGKALSPILVQSAEEYETFRKEYRADDFIFQKYIDGESYYLLYYFSRSGKVYCLSQQNLIQQPDGKSIIAACCSKMHLKEPIAHRYENLFQKEGFRGFVMVELRKSGGAYYMIEANPRLWGPSQLFCDSGYNFFEYFLYDYNFLKEVPERNTDYDAKYFWSGGMTAAASKEKACSWHSDKNNTFQHFKDQFICCDIYHREDTMEIYQYELEGNHENN